MRILWVVGLAVVVGCTSPRVLKYVNSPPPPSEEIRAQLGPIAVVTAEKLPSIEFTQPMGRGQAARHGGWAGFWGPPVVLAQGSDARGFIAGLFLSPVTGTAGAIYGGVAGMSKKEYDQITAGLQKVVWEVDVATRMNAAVTDAIRQLTPEPVVLQTNMAQTILELTPALIRLTGKVEIEPPLTFECVVYVRLLQLSDCGELFAGTFVYDGAAHSLRDWAEHDGERLCSEFANACDCLSRQIAEQMFLVYSLPDSPAQQRVLPWPPQEQH